MDVSNDHRLQPADHEAIYFNRIRFDHLDHVVPSDHPRAIILGGQSGAGKSSVANAAVRELGGDMAVVRIDTDEIRSYHPSYRELAAAGKDASNATQHDAQRWRDRLETEAIQSHRNLVIDTTLGWPESAVDTAQRLQDHGYQVEVRVLSAHRTESQLGIALRYYQQVERQGGGRWVNRDYHDGVYDRIPQSLESLEVKKLVQAIRIISREGNEVHTQQLDHAAQWNTDSMASQVLQNDRAARAANPQVVGAHFKGWSALEQSLDALNISGREREELHELRRAHELELLGRVQKRSARAEDFLHGRAGDVLRKYPNDDNLRNAYNTLAEAHRFSQTLNNPALQKLVLADVNNRLADSLDTGRDIPKIAGRDYEQLRNRLEREGPAPKRDDGPDR